jgi:predicted aspartyl protease
MVRRMQAPIEPPSFVGNRARLPMTFEQGIPVVEVRLNGRGPYRFAIDTGAAGHGRIRPAVAQALGLSPSGEVRAGDGSGRSEVRRSYRLDELSVGAVKFGAVELSDMPNLPGRLERVDGILGRHLFANHLLTLDYARGSLALGREHLPAGAASYTADGRGIVIPLAIGDATLPVALDTGNAVAPLILPQALADRLPRRGEPRRSGQARTAVSTIDMWEVDFAAPVRAGGAVLPVTSARYPTLGETGNLGSLALRSAVVRIDQRNRRFAITVPGRARRRR